jgi:hypothetical protein
MTIEFWPRRLLRPRSRTKKPPKKRKPKRPKLPIGAGKAQQLLSSAILRGDHELASWIDSAVKRSLVTGTTECLGDLSKRLDNVMEPLPDGSPPRGSEPATDTFLTS